MVLRLEENLKTVLELISVGVNTETDLCMVVDFIMESENLDFHLEWGDMSRIWFIPVISLIAL